LERVGDGAGGHELWVCRPESVRSGSVLRLPIIRTMPEYSRGLQRRDRMLLRYRMEW
jgi:hypothetical protein